MAVSARERRHFDAIRWAKDRERRERLREALQHHPVERIVEGLVLGDAAQDDEIEAALDRRALGQAQLAQRARMLGLREDRDRRRETA